MKLTTFVIALLTLFLTSCNTSSPNTRVRISLAGEWQTQLGSVTLPGTTDESHIGDTIKNRDDSGRLQRKHSFVGSLTYSKRILIPQSMEGKHVVLFMEKTKPTTLFIDGDSIGAYSHLHTPHIYDITGISAGEHQIDIRIDNSNKSILPEIGGSHAVTEATQTNWNGIVGDFYIEAMPLTHIEHIQTYPNVEQKNVVVKIITKTNEKVEAKFKLTAQNTNTIYTSANFSKELKIGSDTIIIPLQMDDCELWSAENPQLYDLTVKLIADDAVDIQTTSFGMRNFSTCGTQFTINGQPTFLRGKHDACVFPLTGYAPMNKTEWEYYFLKLKDAGFNHIRFHSWCPPEAAFDVADQLGLYLQPELPYWGCLERDNEKLNQFLVNEGYLILNQFGNHPSFVMFALGNELCGDVNLMREWTNNFRLYDNRRLYAFGSNNNLGWLGQQEGEDFFVTCRIGGEEQGKYNTHVRASFSFADAADGGILNGTYPNTRMTYTNAIEKCTVPVVSHETCQYQIFPDFNEIGKYTGVLEAVNFEVFKHRFDSIYADIDNRDNLAQKFHNNSGLFAFQCYKADVEMCLRTPNLGGFQMLDLQDYPGQGSALVGLFDAFMESKDFLKHADTKIEHFCSAIVPLALMDKLTWTNTEQFEADIEIANYSETDCKDMFIWKLQGDGLSEQGDFETVAKSGQVSAIGHIKVPLDKVKNSGKYELSIYSSDYKIMNNYNIWIYADTDSSWQRLRYVTTIDADIYNQINNGATVLYLPRHSNIENVSVGGLFTPDYWSYSMFKTISENIGKPVSPGTLGYCIDPDYSEFADTLMSYFPSETHSDWQWWTIAKNSRPIILDNAQMKVNPAIYVIDNVDRSHKLSTLFEISVGKGHLLVSTTNLDAIQDKPEGRQYMRMLQHFINYYKDKPATSNNVDMRQITDFFSKKVAERNIVGVENLSDYKKK